MRILLFGKNGQVGWELNRSLQPLGEVIALGRDGADFSAPEGLRKLALEIKPNIIVNAVAYTNVDKAEVEEETAEASYYNSGYLDDGDTEDEELHVEDGTGSDRTAEDLGRPYRVTGHFPGTGKRCCRSGL